MPLLITHNQTSHYAVTLPSDVPTAPGRPEIVDYDNKSVDLKWVVPESDGGAPIQKYIVQKKDR